jgi:uncharacterized phage protein (TIGR02218 family)
MPRDINVNLLSRILSSERTITQCLLITTRLGDRLGFTSLNRDVTFNGVVYHAAPGMDLTNVGTEAGTNVDESQVRGGFVENYITEDDLRSRKFDDANFLRFIIDYEFPQYGKITVQKGKLGRPTVADQGFLQELHSLATLLQRPVGDLTSPSCRRLRLGDSGCRLDVVNGVHPKFNIPFRIPNLVVQTVLDDQTFRIAGTTIPDGYFTDGIVYWTTGRNVQQEMDVLLYTLDEGPSIGTIILQEPLPFPIQVGDIFTGEWGCNRTLAACFDVGNVVNRDAEDYLPGREKVLDIP